MDSSENPSLERLRYLVVLLHSPLLTAASQVYCFPRHRNPCALVIVNGLEHRGWGGLIACGWQPDSSAAFLPSCGPAQHSRSLLLDVANAVAELPNPAKEQLSKWYVDDPDPAELLRLRVPFPLIWAVLGGRSAPQPECEDKARVTFRSRTPSCSAVPSISVMRRWSSYPPELLGGRLVRMLTKHLASLLKRASSVVGRQLQPQDLQVEPVWTALLADKSSIFACGLLFLTNSICGLLQDFSDSDTSDGNPASSLASLLALLKAASEDRCKNGDPPMVSPLLPVISPQPFFLPSVLCHFYFTTLSVSLSVSVYLSVSLCLSLSLSLSLSLDGHLPWSNKCPDADDPGSASRVLRRGLGGRSRPGSRLHLLVREQEQVVAA